MEIGQILICYDGSAGAQRAIDAAARLFRAREAVVLDVAPAATVAQHVATAPSFVPGNAFVDCNKADALRRARVGAAYARRAGLSAVPRAVTAPATWEGSLTSRTGSTRW
jgi:hypothetical protein